MELGRLKWLRGLQLLSGGGCGCGGGGGGIGGSGGGGDTVAVATAVAPVVLFVVDDDYAQKSPLEA